MKTTLRWETRSMPAELRTMLRTLAASYPIVEGKGAGVSVSFEPAPVPGVCEVARRGQAATVAYSTPAQAGRALGALLVGLVADGSTWRETMPFTTFGIMLDCSRGAVMTVDHLKVWLRRLALLGYNMLMLYTEDTYELPDEPYFGYQRGAYTAQELKAIDAFAAKLNIEVIPCIQTLGHLEKVLRHSAYADIKDTAAVMLVGERKTYDLVDKMLRQWKNVCRTNRIHIGMDEAHDLGRGRYLDRRGYCPAFDLFSKHLTEVAGICKRHGWRPMIWSDMYFRLGSKTGDYYDPAAMIPRRAIDAIPREVDLVYWHYYHQNKAFYLDWIERHRKMGKEPIVASGIWTWNKYWYDRRLTEANAGACIEACREAGVKELFFTQWGDNGAYCDHDSAFAGMVYCADRAYGVKEPSAGQLAKRFAAIGGGDYAAHILASDIHGGVKGFQPSMWDDPLFETYFRTFAKDDARKMAEVAAGFAALAAKLKPYRRDQAVGDMNLAYCVAKAFADRYHLAAHLVAAYRMRDKRALRAIMGMIPSVRKSINRMAESFRAMWLRHNKPLGLETIQARFGMLDARYREMGRRISEYLAGSTDRIAELDCRCPPQGFAPQARQGRQ